MGAHKECRPANASSISDSTPVVQTIEQPSRGFRHVSQERGLAGSGLAAEHQRLAATGAHAGDELSEDVALPDAVEQAR